MSGTDEGAGRHTRRFPAEGDFVERLEGAERRKLIPQDDIVRMLRLSRRDTLVDLGAGIGYFSLPASTRAGRVIAIDIEVKMFEALRNRIAVRAIRNIDLIRGDVSSLPLATGSADHILAAFVYHEVQDTAMLLRECARVLALDGHLTVIDFQKRETPLGPPVEERMTPGEVQKAAAAYFEVVDSLETDVYYALRFKKIEPCRLRRS